MNKLVILAAAVAAMAACTKSQVVYDDNDVEIGLSPVNYMTTKVQYGPITGTTYPHDEDFGVFAIHTTSPAGTAYNGDTGNFTEYLNNAQFGYKSDGIWHGSPVAYYWPKTGSLYFAGYSPAGTTGTVDYAFSKDTPVMTITDFKQGAYHYSDGTAETPVSGSGYTNEMYDLMWFNVTSSSYDATSETPSVTFNHALSRLRFVFSCANSDLNNLFTITSVTLKNVVNAGDMTVSPGSAPVWNSDAAEDINLYNTSEALVYETPFTIADVLVIPQKTPYIEIKYTQKPGQGVTESLEQTYYAQLTGGSSEQAVDDTWYYSRYYTYQILFSADEIEIKPDVANWVEVPNVTLP